MLVVLHLDGSTDRPATGDPVLAGGRTVGRLGTVVDHVDEGPIALALLKRGLPADTALTTGGETEVAAVIDPESLPPTDEVGAGRLAVEQLRGRAR
jgi:folate-binding Fe-S cluster repair protein YgfZ